MATIFAPPRLACSRAVSIRGWLVPGFCPTTKMSSACSKSSSVTVPLPMPMVAPSADAARLVAHVRAVGQVVRAERPHEQLVEERGLVARAARRVEDGAVGRGEAVQLGGDEVEGVVPRDRLVVVGAGWAVHRLGEPALLAQPVVAALGQLGRPGARRRTPRSTRRVVASSATALAPFSQNSKRDVLCGLGPRAARAVEALLLVEPEQRAHAPAQAHLVVDVPERADHRGQSGRRPIGCADLELLVALVLDRRRLRHRRRTYPAVPGTWARRWPGKRPEKLQGCGRAADRGQEDPSDDRGVPRDDLLRPRGEGALRRPRGRCIRQLLPRPGGGHGRGVVRDGGGDVLQLPSAVRGGGHPRVLAGRPARDVVGGTGGGRRRRPPQPPRRRPPRCPRDDPGRRARGRSRSHRRDGRPAAGRRPPRAAGAGRAAPRTVVGDHRAARAPRRRAHRRARRRRHRWLRGARAARRDGRGTEGGAAGQPHVDRRRVVRRGRRPGRTGHRGSRRFLHRVGRALREQIEDRTDQLGLQPYEAIGEEGCAELRELVRPWSKAIVSGGTFGFGG